MNNLKIAIVAVLSMSACPPHVHAAGQNRDGIGAQQMHADRETSQECLNLREALHDEERSQILLLDRTGIHNMLNQPELRREMLQHPRFLRQMMHIEEMRQELLGNEQMMDEMLRNREIHREIIRNREMLAEIERNATYQHIHQEQQADILEELLLEMTPSGGGSRPP